MICINLKNTNPFFCLATEEYLLKNFSDDIFMLWQCENTIVVGKHQNALAEINYRFVRENDITVARRISGGGTVYHDAGNVNFAFIKNVKSPAEISFKQFTRPVVDTLSKLGLKATTSGRNDLLINGYKISGNAEHVYKNRVLHHGTLLFNSDLENLGQAIKVVSGKYESKAVKSNRSKVANISSFLEKEMKIEKFIRFMIETQLENKQNTFYEITKADTEKIQELAIEKFATRDWNFGYSPKYTFNNNSEIDGKTLSIMLEVKKGIITDCSFTGDFFATNNTEKAQKLIGCKHQFEAIEGVFPGEEKTFLYSFF